MCRNWSMTGCLSTTRKLYGIFLYRALKPLQMHIFPSATHTNPLIHLYRDIMNEFFSNHPYCFQYLVHPFD